MPFPKADEKTRELFLSVVPRDPRVQVRAMFGHLSGFVNGNMFCGFFGQDIMVRLPDEERERLLKEKGAAPFAPMGREMRGYVLVPRPWHGDPERVRGLLRQSLEWAAALPAKSPVRAAKRASKRATSPQN